MFGDFFSFLWGDAAYICAMSRRIPFLILFKRRLGWHSKELCILLHLIGNVCYSFLFSSFLLLHFSLNR